MIESQTKSKESPRVCLRDPPAAIIGAGAIYQCHKTKTGPHMRMRLGPLAPAGLACALSIAIPPSPPFFSLSLPLEHTNTPHIEPKTKDGVVGSTCADNSRHSHSALQPRAPTSTEAQADWWLRSHTSPYPYPYRAGAGGVRGEPDARRTSLCGHTRNLHAASASPVASLFAICLLDRRLGEECTKHT